MYNRDNQQKSPAKRFLLVFGLVMFSLYFVLGVLILFWKDIPLEIPTVYRVVFGIALIVYAFFRFLRLLKSPKP